MTDAAVPDLRTFDIVQVLLGREYPTTEVPFFLNEQAAFALHKAEEKRQNLPVDEDEASDERRALDEEIAVLREQVNASRHVYHLRGISAKTRGELLDAAYAKFPRETDTNDVFGGEKDSPERDELFGILLLQAMTEKIVAPNGAVMADLSQEQVQQFRDLAPDAALEAIAKAQRELSEGAKSGFELAAQEPDFSSRR